MKLVLNRVFTLAATAALIAASAGVASAQGYGDPFASCHNQVTTSAKALNVRSTPDLYGTLVATLPRGNVVDARSCASGWCEIYDSYSPSFVGYSSERFLTCSAAASPAPAPAPAPAPQPVCEAPVAAAPSAPAAMVDALAPAPEYAHAPLSESGLTNQLTSLIGTIDVLDTEFAAASERKRELDRLANHSKLVKNIMQEILRSSLVGDSLITEANEAKKRAELEAQIEEKLRAELQMEAEAVAAKAAAANAAVPAAADNSDLIKQLLPILLAQAMGN